MNRAVTAREAEFWDDQAVPLDDALRRHAAGPDVLMRALIEALEPLHGKRVLDFACGVGLLGIWLSERGAEVVGVDVSPGSIERARELAAAVGSSATFVTGLVSADTPPGTFDRVCGRFALHHTDLSVTAPILAGKLAPGGRAAFLETMATNPLLAFARSLTGRFGIPRFGTVDEHPLTRADLALLDREIGRLTVTAPQLVFLRLVDRQLLQFRYPIVSRPLRAIDDTLGRLGLDWLSYQQLLVFDRDER